MNGTLYKDFLNSVEKMNNNGSTADQWDKFCKIEISIALANIGDTLSDIRDSLVGRNEKSDSATAILQDMNEHFEWLVTTGNLPECKEWEGEVFATIDKHLKQAGGKS